MPGNHGTACQCEHDLANPSAGTEWLEKYIDFSSLTALNEETDRSCVKLFRSYNERLADPDPSCRSTTPEENEFDSFEEGLVITVPFCCPVRLTGITIIGGESGRSPTSVRLFSNLVDPSAVMEVEPAQSIDPLAEDFCGVIEYPLRVVKFSQVNCLTLHFPPMTLQTELFYIGLKGVASGDQRKAVVTVYESRANLADHQTRETQTVSRQIQ